ncbi:hypothetical protein FRC02_004519 [Tulasnella sp. 418]|nr:hypothetical protein FRC02_004519 [Tulasnella sp. 418]
MRGKICVTLFCLLGWTIGSSQSRVDKLDEENDCSKPGWHCAPEPKDIKKAITWLRNVRHAGTPEDPWPIKTEAIKYDRKRFGSGWEYYKGFSMRDWILNHYSLVQVQVEADEEDGQVRIVQGYWISPYDQEHVEFDDPQCKLDIDHIVPLKDAWISGAQHWDDETRKLFANNEINLIPVSRSSNREKGQRGPADFLPDNHEYWCNYAVRWALVKVDYPLIVEEQEWNCLAEIVQNFCPGAGQKAGLYQGGCNNMNLSKIWPKYEEQRQLLIPKEAS